MDRYLGIVKLFVVAAGVLILAGTGVLGWLLIQRERADGAPAAAPVAAPAAAPVPAAETRADLALPPGTVVIDMRLDGSTALLLLRSVDGQEHLALIEPATGRRISLLRLVPDVP